MCFSDSKCKEFETKVRLIYKVLAVLRASLTSHTHSSSFQDLNKKDIIRRVAALWKSISDKDRAEWEEAARNDKLRYVA